MVMENILSAKLIVIITICKLNIFNSQHKPWEKEIEAQEGEAIFK